MESSNRTEVWDDNKEIQQLKQRIEKLEKNQSYVLYSIPVGDAVAYTVNTQYVPIVVNGGK